MGTMMMLGALVATLLGGTPIDFDDGLIKGQIVKPHSVMLVSPPKAIHMSIAPEQKTLVAARARLAKGPRLAADLVVMAHGRAAETQAQLLDAYAVWDQRQSCFSRGECPTEGEPPFADHREAIGWLDEAAKAPGADAVAIERLALTAQLANEMGPAQDVLRAKQALSELAVLASQGPIAQWARMTLAELYFDVDDLKRAKAAYEQAIEADPSSSYVGFLHYKLAWTLYNLDDVPAAIARMTMLLEAPTSPPELLHEAEDDLVRFYAARPELVDAGTQLFIAKAGTRASGHLLALLEAYLDAAQPVPARTLLGTLDKRDLSADQRARLESVRARLDARP